MLQEVFRPKEMTTSESVIEYARHRQGIVLVVSLLVAFLLLAGLHQFVNMRNAQNVTNATAVPLTELADLQNQADETKPMPMPALDFQYEGRPQVMRTFIVERGAATPPEVVAAQQAAAAEAAAKKAAAMPAPPAAGAPQVGSPRVGLPQQQPGVPAVRPKPTLTPAPAIPRPVVRQ
jgi:hypothetical protein